MNQEVMSDLAELEPYFTEQLEAYPSEFTITAAMWPMLSQCLKDALEADLVEAGYELKKVRSASYYEGKIYALDVVINRK